MSTLDLNAIRNYFAGQPIVKAWLFGSYARGGATEKSDVDILVTFDKSARVGLLKHADLIISLEKLLHRPVDIVADNALLPWVRPTVDADKILIYER